MNNSEKVYFMNGKKWTRAQTVKKGIKQCLMSYKREEYETQCADCPFYDRELTVEECQEMLQEWTLDLLDEYEKRIAIMTEWSGLGCFHCGNDILLWDSDDVNDSEEFIVHHLHCPKCNARVEYYIGK